MKSNIKVHAISGPTYRVTDEQILQSITAAGVELPERDTECMRQGWHNISKSVSSSSMLIGYGGGLDVSLSKDGENIVWLLPRTGITGMIPVSETELVAS